MSLAVMFARSNFARCTATSSSSARQLADLRFATEGKTSDENNFSSGPTVLDHYAVTMRFEFDNLRKASNT
jgi:hypothetical protein